MDGNIYDQFGEAIDRRLGGMRAEAQRRAAAGPPPPAMFRLWQEKEEPPIGLEEVGSDEEVTQGLRGGSETEEVIIIESDDEDEEERTEPLSVLFEKMEDLLDKMGRYQQKLVGLCEEVKGWRSNIPTVFLYDSGPESAPGRPGVNMVGSCPQSGMRKRPLTPQARLAQAARTTNQAKASASEEPPRREPKPGRRKEAVEVEDDDDEEEEDERLRRKEDQRAEQRSRKKGTRGEAEPVIHDGPPKKKKYAVRLEEGFDVEKVIDRLLEGHNDLMTLKEILASAPRLHDELKGRLSRRLVPNVHFGTILPKEAEWAESGTKMDWKNTGPRSIRNQPNPGSFTIEESEGERRRLWVEPEAGERVEAFPLSLSDVGKAMDLVAAHEMADPDAIQTLREQVLECPEAGRLELVYRLPGSGGNPASAQTQSERTLMVELMKRKHHAYAFSDEERGRLNVDKIPMIRIHTMPHEPWNMRGARYPNPDEERKVVDYLDGKICTHVADYSSGPYASPWFCFIKPNGTLWSDFTKTVMPRGGRGTRPPRRPLGASGGYKQHGSRHRESTPVYDDGDIELFLDNFWDHARRMGWTVAQAIEGLRGVGRFEEPVARIRREATTRSEVEWRMQELQTSPMGPDGRPIHLEIENVADFIPAFEWFMQGQGIPRDEWARTLPLWTRKPERALATQRLRDPEPREARLSRGGRKALARREEELEREPEVEERGAYPEYGLGPVEFHRFTEGGLRRSPAHTREEPPVSEGPLRELETHLDISQWRASPQDEKHEERVEGVPREEVPQEEVPREEVPREEVPREEVPREEVPREEAQGTQRESRVGDVGRRAGKEVIEVGEDTPHRRQRKAKERIDRKIKFLAKTTFDRQLLLESDLAGKKLKEASHGVRLEAMKMKIQELRALVVSQAAIIESLRQQTQEKVDKSESSRQGEQRQPGEVLPGQSSAEGPRQEPPMGRIILEPEEARAQRQAEREAFEFRDPTELATLSVAAAGSVVSLAVEEGLRPSSSEPAQGSAEGSMGVLLEAVHTMQEEVSLFSPEQRIEEPLERQIGIEAAHGSAKRDTREETSEVGHT
ncbi:hypothetical protein CBR_g21317 [Chara braunii]|uniref:Uncharacterized protein n=1 Tax=Chara braunii TaxID=69332 RepID=A0A388L1A1_CHABU|nr:hypothetical protein CBR_g21317 [Chara braunii]|eukprot:GBG76077.1 hypothetical protein CBR_g21317 [Chara braunii]